MSKRVAKEYGEPKNIREARAFVRRHWQEFMRGADCPDLLYLGENADNLVAKIFADESNKLADRLEPRK